MAFLPALIGGVLGIGGSIIAGNAQKNAANQAANQQQQYNQDAYNQELQYITQQEQAQRAAVMGLAQGGNPYLGAGEGLPGPAFAQGGSFGPGSPLAGSPSPLQSGTYQPPGSFQSQGQPRTQPAPGGGMRSTLTPLAPQGTAFPPDGPGSTYSTAAYHAAIAAGASPAQATQFAGSQGQYLDNPSNASAIVPGESASQAQQHLQAQSQQPNVISGLNPSQSQINALAPAPLQAFGNIPTVAPTNVNTSAMPGALQSFENLNAQALAPTFQAQNLALQDNLGSRGIVNSGAASYLNNQLAGEQAAALAGADAPLVQQQSGFWNQAQSQNAQAGNTASALNAQNYGSAIAGNQAAYNDYLSRLYGSGQAYGGGIQGAYLGSFGGANPSALSTLGQAPALAGSAYQGGFQNAAPAGGFAAGLNSLGSAFSAPKQNGWQNDAGQADMGNASFGSY